MELLGGVRKAIKVRFRELLVHFVQYLVERREILVGGISMAKQIHRHRLDSCQFLVDLPRVVGRQPQHANAVPETNGRQTLVGQALQRLSYRWPTFPHPFRERAMHE